MTNTYSFDEIKEYIVGKHSVGHDYITFYIYTNHAPQTNDKIKVDNDLYRVEHTSDATTDDEREEGLSYSWVWMQKI